MNETRNEEFEALLDFLRRSRGFDFDGYKRLSLIRRVSRRMQMVGIEKYPEYRDYLEVHPDEFSQLFNMILINVTSFFRDESAWEYLQQAIVPKIIANKTPEETIRVWCAGCASGEEAYTLAMVLAEVLSPEVFLQRVKLYATDVDEEALAQARLASYKEKDIASIPLALRRKYFTQNDKSYNFRSDLRHNVIFGRHDLFQDAPISRLDLLVCRNTLMYFNAEAQRAILNRFHFALNEQSYLFLGKAEMLLTQRQLFNPAEMKHRIFIKSVQLNPRERLLALMPNGNGDGVTMRDRQTQLYEMVLNSVPLAQIVVDYKGNLVMLNEGARSLFNLDYRDVGRPLQDLEISYRPVELRSLIESAFAGRRIVKLDNIERIFADGSTQYLDLLITPLLDGGLDGASLGVSIVFTDITQSARLRIELLHTNQELETAHEELQSTNEELETTNEELETTNEELQSTNEELETMNEELQSTNEELQTINNELRVRSDELLGANTFLGSVLTGLRAGVVVVDHNLIILEWNRRMEDMWGLHSQEVLGKSVLDLDIGLQIGHLALPAFVADISDFQEMTLEAINRRGKPICCHITLTKFRRSGELDGGLILLIEELPVAA